MWGGRISELALTINNPEDPDRPVVQILVGGRDPFTEVAPGWGGFDPNDILGSDSPLLPVPHGRRVAVYRCSCGEAGCGCIAPIILPSADGRFVHWLDFGDFVGRFSGPLDTGGGIGEPEGKPWPLPDFRFRHEQYVGEIERASADLSYETPRRRTARLLRERLAPLAPVLPPDLRLRWVVPSWEGEGVALSFDRPGRDYRQVVLQLTSRQTDPEAAAADLARQLLGVPPADWARRFGSE